MKNIAFFGGTFDPPHRGHLAMARAAANRFALDHVLFAPAAVQPVKAGAVQASFVERYAMVCLATQHDPRFVPSLIDTPRFVDGIPRPNYTVETLARLRSGFAARGAKIHLYVLLGADSWLTIAAWREPEKLLEQSDWIIAGRPGFALDDVPAALPKPLQGRCAFEHASGEFLLRREEGGPIRIAVMADLNEAVSGTALRNARSSGEKIQQLLPDAVADYIEKRRLYIGWKSVGSGGDEALV